MVAHQNLTACLLLVAVASAPGCGGGNPAGSERLNRRTAAADRLPDLGMAPLSDLRISQRPDGDRLLRYSTTIVNVGSGPFELHGRRASSGEAGMSIVQRIFDSAGRWRDVQTPAGVEFGGDGHAHWHVHDLQASALTRLADGADVGRSDKRGFCFWDNTEYRLTLAGAPPSPVYDRDGCGDSASLAVSMGLSVGWGDIYPWTLPDQYLDVTGLPAGAYRLTVTADPAAWFVEESDANQATWVDVELTEAGGLLVLAHGPSA